MDHKYFVIRRCMCNDCMGTGFVEHPLWVMYRKSECGVGPYEWFGDMGYSTLPEEEVKCKNCGGSGEVEEYVNLYDALREIGWMPNAVRV